MQPSRLRRRQRRRLFGNGALAVSTLLFGTMFAADAKSITVVVNGHTAEVRTLTDDVGSLLDSVGVPESPGIRVLPAAGTALESGMVVMVDYTADNVPQPLFDGLATMREFRELQETLKAKARHRLEVLEKRRKERIRRQKEAAKKAAEEAAAREAARKAAIAAAMKAAEQEPNTAVTGCNQDWHTVEGVKQLIACAVGKWSVPGGVQKALDVAWCEHGFQWWSPPDATHVGVYQHSARYWPERAAAYGFAGYDARNGRANIMVAIHYVHDHGWGAWSCA